MTRNAFVIGFSVFKSSRSNSICEILSLKHYDNCSDKSYIQKIVGVLSQISFLYNQTWKMEHRKIYAKIYVSKYVDEYVFDNTGEMKDQRRLATINLGIQEYIPKKFLETVLNIIHMCDPDCRLSPQDLLINPSIQHYLRNL